MSEKEGTCEGFPKSPFQSPDPLIHEHLGNSQLGKDDIVFMLDKIEGQVEKIRKMAFEIEEKRDSLFTTLHTIKHSRIFEDLSDNDRDDMDRYLTRIYDRCSTIEVNVKTVRDKPQEDALHKINGIIDKLIMELQTDPCSTRVKCLSFMNSCSSCIDNGIEDKNFEQALLCCTMDDQKRVRRRLQGLMTYIEKLSFTTETQVFLQGSD